MAGGILRWFFDGDDRWWHFFDIVLVLSAIAEIVTTELGMNQRNMPRRGYPAAIPRRGNRGQGPHGPPWGPIGAPRAP